MPAEPVDGLLCRVSQVSTAQWIVFRATSADWRTSGRKPSAAGSAGSFGVSVSERSGSCVLWCDSKISRPGVRSADLELLASGVLSSGAEPPASRVSPAEAEPCGRGVSSVNGRVRTSSVSL